MEKRGEYASSFKNRRPKIGKGWRKHERKDGLRSSFMFQILWFGAEPSVKATLATVFFFF